MKTNKYAGKPAKKQTRYQKFRARMITMIGMIHPNHPCCFRNLPVRISKPKKKFTSLRGLGSASAHFIVKKATRTHARTELSFQAHARKEVARARIGLVERRKRPNGPDPSARNCRLKRKSCARVPPCIFFNKNKMCRSAPGAPEGCQLPFRIVQILIAKNNISRYL